MSFSQQYQKDPITGVIINNNDEQYKMILQERERKKESEALEDQIKSLQSELTIIKTLLVEIVNGRNNG